MSTPIDYFEVAVQCGNGPFAAKALKYDYLSLNVSKAKLRVCLRIRVDESCW